MASSYLIQKEAEYKAMADREKNEMSANIRNQIYQLQNSYQRHEQVQENTNGYKLAGATAAAGALFAFPPLLVGAAIGAGAGYLINKSRKDKVDAHNQSVDQYNQQVSQQIADLQAEELVQCQKIDDKYAKKLEQETNRFKNSVKASRVKYGGRTAAKPIVKWLGDEFEKMIMNADRRPHVKDIQVVFAFRTEQYMVTTLKRVYGGAYGNAEVFDFNINRFHALPDFEDRIGFSQAIAKLVQFDIMSRFPKDPLSPSPAKPLVVITSDDALMELRYQVANPNYRPAVTL